MKSQFARFSLISLVATSLFLIGCGGDAEPEAMGTDQAAETMDTMFSDADQATQQNANAAAEAMRAQNYQDAYKNLMAMQQRKSMSAEQGLATRESVKALRIQILEAAANGDPEAQKMARAISQSLSR
jgi:hypothetical protein